MSRRVSIPSSEVPFLTDKRIEEEANLLLAEYSEQQKPILAPPIPIDEIIELHLKLTFEVQDLQQLCHAADVHGAIWINEARLAVDQSLDPSRNPRKLGRYRFTLAHETGHWHLHRTHYLKDEAQRALFDKQSDAPAYICRSSQKPRVEMQADHFSAFLLMPREMVFREWEKHHKSLDPVTLDQLRENEQERIASEMLHRSRINHDRNSLDNLLLEGCGRTLAERFEVSPEAMRIRLESLGLLVRKKENMLFE